MPAKQCCEAAEDLLRRLRRAPTTRKAEVITTGPGTMCDPRPEWEPVFRTEEEEAAFHARLRLKAEPILRQIDEDTARSMEAAVDFLIDDGKEAKTRLMREIRAKTERGGDG